MDRRAERTTTMAEKKLPPASPDADATDQIEDQDHDKDREQKTAHPGYTYYRKTRQFGG